jgi:WXG100 family type VII secretion target
LADDTISVPIEQVRHLALEFRAASGDSMETVQRLHRAVYSLEGQWDGYAQQRFFQEYRQWELMMRQFAQLLENVGVQLGAIADDFTEADRQIARKLAGPRS